MTYRITPEEEDEIDRAYDDRDAARARARRLQAEIERLRKEKDIAIAHSVAVVKDFQAMESERNATIEECARVAESQDTSAANTAGWAIARAIRALKEKP